MKNKNNQIFKIIHYFKSLFIILFQIKFAQKLLIYKMNKNIYIPKIYIL